MSKRRKNNLKYSSAWILLICLLGITSYLNANYNPSKTFYDLLTTNQDSSRKMLTRPADTVPVRLGRDTVPRVDSITTRDTFSVKMSNDTLDAPIQYSAADSMVLDIPNNRIILFSKGNVIYKDINLTADSIEMDQTAKMVTATFRRDSTGQVVGKPHMVQGESNMDADIIRYNMETQRGITQNTITQQGEMYVQGEKIKKVSQTDLYAFRGQITTCNLDIPHFCFRAKKMKLVNQKLAVTGPIHPEFEGVPVPVYLPFGFFPLSQGRHSGFLPPRFSVNDQFGLGLEQFGYYKVLNDYFDATLRANLYSYGGWSLFLTPTYRVRYRYNGSFNFAYQRTRILSNDPKQDFINSRTFNVTWSHSMDSRARPGVNFSANVNAGSTKFNRYLVNDFQRNYSNQLSSSITYSKTWGSKYNLTASANHSQNNNSGQVSVSLPNIAFTVNTFYPLQKKDFVGTPKWYEKLGIGLNTNIANQINFYDSAVSFSRILDTMQWGAQHNIPIQLALPQLGPLQIAPGISYQEKWHSRRLTRSWNPVARKIDSSLERGFYTTRDVSFSLGLSTAIFGMFDRFGKNSAVRAIRHVIRPSVSVSYKPDMAKKDFYETQVDTAGHRLRYSYYDGSIFGAFSEGQFGGINFTFDNNLEMKVRSKKDTADGGIKKIRLLDGFGFTGSYNFLADSQQLSPISLYIRSTLFEKINITASGTLDPYQTDSAGFRLNKYAWQGNKFSLGRITSGNIAISTTFQSKPKDEEKQKQLEEAQKNSNLPPMTMEEQMAQMEYVRKNPGEFSDFNIPWSVNLSFSLSFSKFYNTLLSKYESSVNSNFNFNGDFNLTPKWKMGLNGYYDFNTSAITALTMFITREMHCWQLSINVTPVGLYRSFNITISPKSGILRDLRINRSRSFYGG
jgi:LPS-assembly protein